MWIVISDLTSRQRGCYAKFVFLSDPRLRPCHSIRLDTGASLLWKPLLISGVRADGLTDADIVCSRSRNHYPPDANPESTEVGSQVSQATDQLERFQQAYRPLHSGVALNMYFMVRSEFVSLLPTIDLGFP